MMHRIYAIFLVLAVGLCVPRLSTANWLASKPVETQDDWRLTASKAGEMITPVWWEGDDLYISELASRVDPATHNVSDRRLKGPHTTWNYRGNDWNLEHVASKKAFRLNAGPNFRNSHRFFVDVPLLLTASGADTTNVLSWFDFGFFDTDGVRDNLTQAGRESVVKAKDGSYFAVVTILSKGGGTTGCPGCFAGDPFRDVPKFVPFWIEGNDVHLDQRFHVDYTSNVGTTVTWFGPDPVGYGQGIAGSSNSAKHSVVATLGDFWKDRQLALGGKPLLVQSTIGTGDLATRNWAMFEMIGRFSLRQLSVDRDHLKFLCKDGNFFKLGVMVDASTRGLKFGCGSLGTMADDPAPTYWWQVERTLGGTSGGGTVPTQVTLVSPANSATGVSRNTGFDWNDATGATSYKFQLSTVHDFGSIVGERTPTTSNVPAGTFTLDANRSYYWRVRGVNSAGDGPWSSQGTFTTGSASVLGVPQLVGPADGSTVSQPVTLDWNGVSNATSYDVRWSQNTDFSNAQEVGGLTETQYTIPAGSLAGGSTYYWDVRARNATEVGLRAPMWSFVTSGTTGGTVNVTFRVDLDFGNCWPVTGDWIELHFPDGTKAVLVRTEGRLTRWTVDMQLAPGGHQVRYWANRLGEEVNWRTITVPSSGGLLPVAVFKAPSGGPCGQNVATAIGDEEVPQEFALHQNYPNPFNPSTTIAFDLPAPARVHLVVYNLLSREVAVLVDGIRAAGRYEATFNTEGLPSGVYLYRLSAGDEVRARQMLLVK